MAGTGLTSAGAELFLKHAVGISAWTMPTAVYVRRHSADPGADGASNYIETSGVPVVFTYENYGGYNQVYNEAYPLSPGWPDPTPGNYWSIEDQAGVVLFQGGTRVFLSGGDSIILRGMGVVADDNDYTSGSGTATQFRGTDAAATATVYPGSVAAGTLTGATTATAELVASYAGQSADVSVSATASVGGSGSGTGYVSASIEATSFAQIGGSIPAVIEAFERRLSDVQVSMFVVG